MREKKVPLIFSLLASTLFLIFCVVLTICFKKMDYEWNFSSIPSYFWQEGKPGLLLLGIWGTFYISFFSIILGSLLGFLIGLLLISEEPVSKKLAYLYVEIFRNTPVLVQIYLAYFVVGTLFNLSPLQAGVLTLTAFCAAYVAEIFRGTLENFDKGQVEAAKSLGMTSFQVFSSVVFPQALRRMLPALIGQFVSLVKDSSLVSVLGTLDLTKAALNIVSVSFRSFETWFLVAFLYLLMNFSISALGRKLESYLGKEFKPHGN